MWQHFQRGSHKGDLGVISFFYLLCVGEYTSSWSRQLQRTRHFQTKDVSFHRNRVVLDPLSRLDELLTATGATLKLTNQKNGVWSSCVHHHAIANKCVCPIRALAWQVHHVLSNGSNGDNMMCTFFDRRG